MQGLAEIKVLKIEEKLTKYNKSRNVWVRTIRDFYNLDFVPNFLLDNPYFLPF